MRLIFSLLFAFLLLVGTDLLIHYIKEFQTKNNKEKLK